VCISEIIVSDRTFFQFVEFERPAVSGTAFSNKSGMRLFLTADGDDDNSNNGRHGCKALDGSLNAAAGS